jgi:hypothetical protein
MFGFAIWSVLPGLMAAVAAGWFLFAPLRGLFAPRTDDVAASRTSSNCE